MPDRNLFLCMKKKGVHTAPRVSTMRRRLKITHAFHPQFGKEFDLVSFTNTWKKQYVQFTDEDGHYYSVPIGWTDAAGGDPFVEFSNGRSHFRVEELLRLVDLVSSLNEGAVKKRGSISVK